MNELKKEYCVKIKLIAHDWQCVTLISWFQMNHYVHSSPDLHKVEGEHIFFLEKLKITPWKSLLFWCFFCEVISNHFCSHLYFSKYKWYYFNTSHMCDLVFALLLAIWWFCFGFGSCEWKRQKNNSVQLFSWEVKLFWKITF